MTSEPDALGRVHVRNVHGGEPKKECAFCRVHYFGDPHIRPDPKPEPKPPEVVLL
jgi:hypothetical protein